MARSRLRIVFFAALTAACLVDGDGPAMMPAVAGLTAGVLSLYVAQRRGDDLAYSFAVVDWLLLAGVIALAGGADHWLVLALPALPFIQLVAAPPSDWPYLLLPALALVAVLATADPSLGGSGGTGLLELTVLVAAGAGAAALARRPARLPPVVSVDTTTGFYTTRRLPALLEGLLDDAASAHAAVSVVYLRLTQFQDVRDFAGAEGSEVLVAAVARRIQRHLERDDLAFRVGPDAFVLALPGRGLNEARAMAAAIDGDVAGSLICGRRQRVESGIACFPTVRRLEDLLREARANARHEPCELALAVAQ